IEDLFCLDFDAGNRIYNDKSRLRDPHGAAGVLNENTFARCIEKIDFGLVPLVVSDRAGNADLPLNFFGIEIGHSGTVIHPAKSIPHAPKKRAARHKGSLAARPVPDYCHIANVGSAKNLHRKLLSRSPSPRSAELFLDEAAGY